MDVCLSIDGCDLPGELDFGERAIGSVIFAHGSGSSRLSPRNRAVAAELRERGFATLLFDLLTEEEARHRTNVFDIPLLGRRVCGAVRWARENADIGDLPIGLFGASTGAAAALVAAAEIPNEVAAVVSRGGRPDLAGGWLARVKCPTLLVVGGADTEVLTLNRVAFSKLRAKKSLEIVPGATHLFEELGALDQVVELAATWFQGAFDAMRP